VKLVLLSILVVGALGSITVPRVYALFSTGEANTGASISSGTLTLNDDANYASTTLSAAITAGQTTINVASAIGFPSAGTYTIQVDSEQMTVTGGQGTNTWTVTRGVNGTTAATHAASASVATADCRTIDGANNVNTSCDGLLAYSAGSENYPGTPATATVRIYDSGSLGASDLVLWMPSCTRGITGDAPFSTPTISSFGAASTAGGHLAGGTTYYYELTAVSASGESVAGTEAVYTPPSGTSTNQITLNWSAVAGATGYKVYRSTSEGGEQLLAALGNVTSYADTSATVPSGSPPSGTGSGNPCATGTAQISVQETTAGGANKQCWYPSTATSCAFSGTSDLGAMAQSHNTLGTAVDLGSGPAAVTTRYFKLAVQFPSTAANALQGTTANFTLRWHATS
jgi:hypothetical protein